MNKIIFLLTVLLAPALSFSATPEDQAVDYISLSRAAGAGDIISVKVLIKRGVSPNGIKKEAANNDAGYMAGLIDAPIVTASKGGYIEIVKLLLSEGADPNWCCCSCVTALHEAIIGKHTNVVKILLDNGADTSILYDGMETCEQLAAKSGSKEIMKMISNAKNKKRVKS